MRIRRSLWERQRTMSSNLHQGTQGGIQTRARRDRCGGCNESLNVNLNIRTYMIYGAS